MAGNVYHDEGRHGLGMTPINLPSPEQGKSCRPLNVDQCNAFRRYRGRWETMLCRISEEMDSITTTTEGEKMSKQSGQNLSKEVKLLEDTLGSVARGEARTGTVTGTERMRAALALLVLKAAQNLDSDEGKEVSASELQLIVHLVNGDGALPKEKTWWEKLLKALGGLAGLLGK